MYMFLMRDEKEERKKQARSNKQTRQSNTALVHVQYNKVNILVNTWTLVSCSQLLLGYMYILYLCSYKLYNTFIQFASEKLT